MTKPDSAPSDLPDWLRGDPVAEDLRARFPADPHEPVR